MSRFWSLRRQSPVEGSAAVQPVEQLEPVEFYTAAALMTGLVAPNGRRLSDLLNEGAPLRVRDLTLTPYKTDVPVRLAEPEEWRSVEVDDVLLVMPPEQASPKQLRVYRRQERVRMTVGDFEVTGNLHLLPGTSFGQYRARRTGTFVPVTKAIAFSGSDPAWERVAPVLLVNAKHVSDVRDVLSIL
jgi:hypothetical protein